MSNDTKALVAGLLTLAFRATEKTRTGLTGKSLENALLVQWQQFYAKLGEPFLEPPA
jgi:hypothetical protein